MLCSECAALSSLNNYIDGIALRYGLDRDRSRGIIVVAFRVRLREDGDGRYARAYLLTREAISYFAGGEGSPEEQLNTEPVLDELHRLGAMAVASVQASEQLIAPYESVPFTYLSLPSLRSESRPRP